MDDHRIIRRYAACGAVLLSLGWQTFPGSRETLPCQRYLVNREERGTHPWNHSHPSPQKSRDCHRAHSVGFVVVGRRNISLPIHPAIHQPPDVITRRHTGGRQRTVTSIRLSAAIESSKYGHELSLNPSPPLPVYLSYWSCRAGLRRRL